jgi:hypothetical protein
MLNQILTLLGGGLLGVLFQAWRSSADQRDARRAEYVARQLQLLYGPIHYFCRINKRIYEHKSKLARAHRTEYLDTDYTNDPHLHAAVRDEALKATQLENQYEATIIDFNKRIVATMVDNWSLVDANDRPALEEFTLESLRYETEFPNGEWTVTLRIQDSLPMIKLHSTDFVDTIDARIAAKSQELAALRRRPFNCLTWIQNEIAALEQPSEINEFPKTSPTD